MEIDRSIYTDLIFHIFAHMKVNNASDTYDEAYVANMEKELSRKTVIPESVTAFFVQILKDWHLSISCRILWPGAWMKFVT